MRKKTLAMACLIILLFQLSGVSVAIAEVPFVVECTADVYEGPTAASKIIGKMRAGQIYYTSEADRQGTWIPVYFEDLESEQHAQGWIDESTLDLPSTPHADNTQANPQGYVLCQSLTIRKSPDTTATALFSMEYQDTFDILDETGDWYQARYRGMERDVLGYVLSDYALKDPAHIELSVETPAYAYPSPDAKRVALLEAGSNYAIIARIDGYAVISVRGASAFIEQ